MMIGRRGRDLGLGRPAALGELVLDPAARDHEPAPLRGRLRGRAQAAERLGERGRADPVHLGREGETGADRVDVRIDQPRNDRAAGKIDHRVAGPASARIVGGASDRDDPLAAHRERLGWSGVERNDLAVEEDRIGGLRVRRACET